MSNQETKCVTPSELESFEIASLISARAAAIEKGETPFIEYGDETRAEIIAWMEFNQGLTPYSIIRTYPDGRKVKIVLKKNC